MMGLIVWVVGGALVGLLASRVMGVRGRGRIALNVVVGVTGATLGGWLYRALGYDRSSLGQGVSFDTLMISLIAAVILLGLSNGTSTLQAGERAHAQRPNAQRGDLRTRQTGGHGRVDVPSPASRAARALLGQYADSTQRLAHVHRRANDEADDLDRG